MGDETGLILVGLWNDQIELLDKVNNGDTIKINNAYSRDNNGRKELHLNDMSKVEVNPEGSTIGEVKQNTADRKKISELSTQDSFVEILGTIVQAFDIRFFEVCPQCNKRVRPTNGVFTCQEHGDVEPTFSYVFNMFIDDGSSNIRVVCFRNQLANLLAKQHEEILQYRESPDIFEAVKHDLLGHIVKIQGRVVNNEMFNRLEIISSRIDRDPNPENELESAKSSSNEVKQEESKPEIKQEQEATQSIQPASQEQKPVDDKYGIPDVNQNQETSELEEDEKVDDSVLDGPTEIKTPDVEPKQETVTETSLEIDDSELGSSGLEDGFFEESPDDTNNSSESEVKETKTPDVEPKQEDISEPKDEVESKEENISKESSTETKSDDMSFIDDLEENLEDIDEELFDDSEPKQD
jgi:hypothetical protein